MLQLPFQICYAMDRPTMWGNIFKTFFGPFFLCRECGSVHLRNFCPAMNLNARIQPFTGCLLFITSVNTNGYRAVHTRARAASGNRATVDHFKDVTQGKHGQLIWFCFLSRSKDPCFTPKTVLSLMSSSGPWCETILLVSRTRRQAKPDELSQCRKTE